MSVFVCFHFFRKKFYKIKGSNESLGGLKISNCSTNFYYIALKFLILTKVSLFNLCFVFFICYKLLKMFKLAGKHEKNVLFHKAFPDSKSNNSSQNNSMTY